MMAICFLLRKGAFIHNLEQWWKEQNNYAVFFHFQKCGCSTTKINGFWKGKPTQKVKQDSSNPATIQNIVVEVCGWFTSLKEMKKTFSSHMEKKSIDMFT